MTLLDAGPAVALFDPSEVDHERCLDALGRLSGPLVTTWPVVTEAMYLLGRGRGWAGQKSLWELIVRKGVDIRIPADAEPSRTAVLMEKYADLPMDLADASLVALAEKIGSTSVFTLDDDFLVYRLPKGKRFKCIPAPA